MAKYDIAFVLILSYIIPYINHICFLIEKRKFAQTSFFMVYGHVEYMRHVMYGHGDGDLLCLLNS